MKQLQPLLASYVCSVTADHRHVLRVQCDGRALSRVTCVTCGRVTCRAYAQYLSVSYRLPAYAEHICNLVLCSEPGLGAHQQSHVAGRLRLAIFIPLILLTDNPMHVHHQASLVIKFLKARLHLIILVCHGLAQHVLQLSSLTLLSTT